MPPRIFAFSLLLASVGVALAEPTTYASRRYTTDLNGSLLQATQFLEYSGGYFEKCKILLNLAEKQYPEQTTVVRNCGISLPAPDGSPAPTIPASGDFYITYEDSALSGQVLKSFTIYHLTAEQLKAPKELCQQILTVLHGRQQNVQCHIPSSE